VPTGGKTVLVTQADFPKPFSAKISTVTDLETVQVAAPGGGKEELLYMLAADNDGMHPKADQLILIQAKNATAVLDGASGSLSYPMALAANSSGALFIVNRGQTGEHAQDPSIVVCQPPCTAAALYLSLKDCPKLVNPRSAAMGPDGVLYVSVQGAVLAVPPPSVRPAARCYPVYKDPAKLVRTPASVLEVDSAGVLYIAQTPAKTQLDVPVLFKVQLQPGASPGEPNTASYIGSINVTTGIDATSPTSVGVDATGILYVANTANSGQSPMEHVDPYPLYSQSVSSPFFGLDSSLLSAALAVSRTSSKRLVYAASENEVVALTPNVPPAPGRPVVVEHTAQWLKFNVTAPKLQPGQCEYQEVM
jgi:hypothetical protein